MVSTIIPSSSGRRFCSHKCKTKGAKRKASETHSGRKWRSFRILLWGICKYFGGPLDDEYVATTKNIFLGKEPLFLLLIITSCTHQPESDFLCLLSQYPDPCILSLIGSKQAPFLNLWVSVVKHSSGLQHKKVESWSVQKNQWVEVLSMSVFSRCWIWAVSGLLVFFY